MVCDCNIYAATYTFFCFNSAFTLLVACLGQDTLAKENFNVGFLVKSGYDFFVLFKSDKNYPNHLRLHLLSTTLHKYV